MLNLSMAPFEMIFYGLGYVFLGLLVLIVIIWILSKVIKYFNNGKKEEQIASVAEVIKEKPVLMKNDQEDGEIVAIIAAVTAIMTGEGKGSSFKIRSVTPVKPVNHVVSAWRQAAKMERLSRLM